MLSTVPMLFLLRREGQRAREREKINLIYESSPFPNILKVKIKNGLKSIKTSCQK
jgi:hypothetical protein